MVVRTAVDEFALVLGGGAGLGAFEIGVIDAMARRGMRPNLAGGTARWWLLRSRETEKHNNGATKLQPSATPSGTQSPPT